MKTADFDYPLPPALIAQTPIEPRDAARLLVYHRSQGRHEHRAFGHLPDYLRQGDLLIANDSRVMPARLRGRRTPTGGQVELLLLSRRHTGTPGSESWEVLARPARRLRTGATVILERDIAAAGVQGACPRLWAKVIDEVGPARKLVEFASDGDVGAALARYGNVPLPPYIRAPLGDPERYQTIYARSEGSAAAPTAGLHFTPLLMQRLCNAGVDIRFVTLHIGLDTFRPVNEEDLETHAIHSEFAVLSEEVAAAIQRARQAGGRIIAAGTTAVRVLESAAGEDGQVGAFSGHTKLFIYPGYRFKAVDALITNFHLPRSTLLMLVSAFAGRQPVLDLYQMAAQSGYRFYSFGDAMLLL